jgi:hypothetical protein
MQKWPVFKALYQGEKMNGKERSTGNALLRGIIVILVGVIIWLLPIPAGVKPEAWHLLAIFVATIVGLILTPLPMGAASSGGKSWGCGKSWPGGGEFSLPPPRRRAIARKCFMNFENLPINS